MTAILEAKDECRYDLQDKCLLFVEDSADDFVLARHELGKLKIANSVKRVSTMEQLLIYLGGWDEYADRTQYPFPAIVFLDLRLPDGSGLDAQAIIRSNIKYRNLPIIMISSEERLAALRSAVTLGADGYMVKPFNGREFARILLEKRISLEITDEI